MLPVFFPFRFIPATTHINVRFAAWLSPSLARERFTYVPYILRNHRRRANDGTRSISKQCYCLDRWTQPSGIRLSLADNMWKREACIDIMAKQCCDLLQKRKRNFRQVDRKLISEAMMRTIYTHLDSFWCWIWPEWTCFFFFYEISSNDFFHSDTLHTPVFLHLPLPGPRYLFRTSRGPGRMKLRLEFKNV